MAAKPGGGPLIIAEQIVEDVVSGVTLQFVRSMSPTAPYRLRIFAPWVDGGREILFDADGVEAGAGTTLGGACVPGWLSVVDDLAAEPEDLALGDVSES